MEVSVAFQSRFPEEVFMRIRVLFRQRGDFVYFRRTDRYTVLYFWILGLLQLDLNCDRHKCERREIKSLNYTEYASLSKLRDPEKG